MKVETFIEYHGKKIEDKSIIEKTKELWLQEGKELKDIYSLNFYVKPEENTVFYVINEKYKGYFHMN